MKKSKKSQLLALFIMCACFLCVQPLLAGQPRPTATLLLPDLAVKLKLVTKKFVSGKGVHCFSVRPEYTITNKGQATARNFEIKEYWKTQGRPWEYMGGSSHHTLAPGKSYRQSPSPIYENAWCADKKDKVGFRITAVYSGREKNKRNNTAVAYFPDFTAHPEILKKKVGTKPAASEVNPK